MGFFTGPEKLNDDIVIRTKDELKDAAAKGYGIITPVGPLTDEIVARMKRSKPESAVTTAGAIASLFICPVAFIPIGIAGLLNTDLVEYSVCMDSGGNYYFKHRKRKKA